QRSSVLPEGTGKVDSALFATALEKRLLAEQTLWATLEATGERERIEEAEKAAQKAPAKGKKLPTPLETARLKFVRAFAAPPREPEEEINPSLKGALFLLNDPLVLDWLTPRPGNLADRLGKETDAGKLADELYLAVLSRRPSAEEKAEVARYLARPGKKKT